MEVVALTPRNSGQHSPGLYSYRAAQRDTRNQPAVTRLQHRTSPSFHLRRRKDQRLPFPP